MNWPTIIVAVLVASAVTAVVVSGIRKKKRGKRFCSCGCSGCAMSDKCHKK